MTDSETRAELAKHIEYHVFEAEQAAKRAANGRDQTVALQFGLYGVIHALLANARAAQATATSLPQLKQSVEEAAPEPTQLDERERAYREAQRTCVLTAFNLQRLVTVSGESASGHSYAYRLARIIGVDEEGFELATDSGVVRLSWSGLRHCRQRRESGLRHCESTD